MVLDWCWGISTCVENGEGSPHREKHQELKQRGLTGKGSCSLTVAEHQVCYRGDTDLGWRRLLEEMNFEFHLAQRFYNSEIL